MTRSPELHPADVLAGLSLAGLLLPEAVAYSGLANLPPQAGVIGLFAGLLCYALIGQSRFAIVTATSSSAAVFAAATLALGADGVAQRAALGSILVAATGCAFLLSGCARLGAMSNLIARPVLRGFSFGLALVIAVKQWPHIVGMQVHSSDFLPMLAEILRGAGAWQPASLGVGVCALAGLFALERVRHVPGVLIVIVAGIAAAPWLASRGVLLTGPIHLALQAPSFAMPEMPRWLPLVRGSLLALMFILYAESYSSIRTYALKHDESVRQNRDLIALGIANIVSGAFHGTPVGAGYSGTSANEAAGAQSRAAGLFAAATILVMVLLFLPWIERIPAPVLAAIVIHAVSEVIAHRSVFRPYFKWPAGPAGHRDCGGRSPRLRHARRPPRGHRLQPRHAAAFIVEPASPHVLGRVGCRTTSSASNAFRRPCVRRGSSSCGRRSLCSLRTPSRCWRWRGSRRCGKRAFGC